MKTVPGILFRILFIYRMKKITAGIGLRYDVHNHYGGFWTPRFHFRYAPSEQWVFRASGGRGQRTVHPFAENVGGFASNRIFHITTDEITDGFYGLPAQIAWTYGGSIVSYLNVFSRSLTLQLDYYYTDFKEQVVIDWDLSPQSVYVYALNGDSRAHSFQTQIDYEILDRWTMRLAYRRNDVQTTYLDGMNEVPLVSKHRGFLNTAYETTTGWSMDATVSWVGRQRLPNTTSNPVIYRVDEYSPDYFMVNSQITKSWNQIFDVYVGVEKPI